MFQKLESSLDEVTLRIHRHSDDQLEMQEKLKDLETKTILLIQAAKNSIEGKSNTHIFDGIGDVVTAIDYLKDMMKGQYAKISEFKEVEKSVDSLNNFYLETQQNKAKEIKEKEALVERIDDLKNYADHLSNQITHIEENRFSAIEDQLIEKLDYNEFETTVNNIREYLDGFTPGESKPNFIVGDSSRSINEVNKEERKYRRNSQLSITEEEFEGDEPIEKSQINRPKPIYSRKSSKELLANFSYSLKKV